MQGSKINHYLVANCLNIIDEFNMLYKEHNKDDLKNIADEKFNEMDITVRMDIHLGSLHIIRQERVAGQKKRIKSTMIFMLNKMILKLK